MHQDSDNIRTQEKTNGGSSYAWVKITSRGRPKNRDQWISGQSVKDIGQRSYRGAEDRRDLRAQDGEREFDKTLKKWTNRINGVGSDRRSGQSFPVTGQLL